MSIFIAGIFTLLIVALDQWFKRWTTVHLQHAPDRVVIEYILGLTYVENRGAAFGLMQGGRWVFIVLTAAVLAVIIYYYVRLPLERKYWLIRVPLIFIFAGAIGNFIDRLRYGFVVDMFEFLFIRFPVFNIADICLVTGTILLAFIFIFVIKEDPVEWKKK
jgi:signal peptidase II